MPITPFTANEIAEKGRAIYREHVCPTLTAADKGKYIVINTVTGEWDMGTDDEKASNRARVGPV